MRDIAINRVMTTQPAAVEPSDLISTARRLLEPGRIHHLPVVEQGLLVGIVSTSDLLKFHLLEGGTSTADETTVSQIMEADPVTLESNASLRDAATKLSVGGYHALPVIEPDRTLVGIVTTSDLITHLLRQLPSGDGSIRPDETSESTQPVGDAEITKVLHQAEQAVQSGSDPANVSRILLRLRDNNRTLKKACHAAELYMRSGHGEREHSVLVKCLSDLQGSGSADL
ncbi:MAG: CBS domain-containing protein [Woeseiaceae bacterium]